MEKEIELEKLYYLQNAILLEDGYAIKDFGRNRSNLWIFKAENPNVKELFMHRVMGHKAMLCTKPMEYPLGGMQTQYIPIDSETEEEAGLLFMTTDQEEAAKAMVIKTMPSKSKKSERIWCWLPVKRLVP